MVQEGVGLDVAGGGADQRAVHLLQAAGGERRDREDLEPLAGGLAQPQEHDRRLVLWLEADQDDGAGALEVGVGDAGPRGDGGGEEVGLLRGVRPGPEVRRWCRATRANFEYA
jgi:hypothetical protein